VESVSGKGGNIFVVRRKQNHGPKSIGGKIFRAQHTPIFYKRGKIFMVKKESYL